MTVQCLTSFGRHEANLELLSEVIRGNQVTEELEAGGGGRGCAECQNENRTDCEVFHRLSPPLFEGVSECFFFVPPL